MAFAARAPGKVVILGEYAVLSGAPALVMAVDRYARARITESVDAQTRFVARPAEVTRVSVAPPGRTGFALVDAICEGTRARGTPPAFDGSLDSTDFFANSAKLGLGSSAAALCAWAGAWAAYCRHHGLDVPVPTLLALVAAHRAFQDGVGSGIDVAASYTGGVLRFALDADRRPTIGSVQLPNSVGFAGVFGARSASTPGLVARYRAWEARDPAAADRIGAMLADAATAGCEAASLGDARDFLKAAADYGDGLEALGEAMQADIVTAEHRRIARVAREFGVVYKTSGAGGGDVGIALSSQPEDLAGFTTRVAEMGFQIVELSVDQRGLIVEESGQ